MTKEQRLMQIYQQQREHAHNQLAMLAAEFDAMKAQRDSAFVFLKQCFQSGQLAPDGVAAIEGLNAWIETNKVLGEVR
jgi:hypothetical protein